MPVLGANSKPGFSYHSYSGTSQPNQEAEPMTLPDQRIRILTLGQWLGGWGGTCRVRLCIWDGDFQTLLAQTAEITVANLGSGDGKANSYTADLITPYEADAGQTILVGFTRHRDDGHNVLTGNAAYTHEHGRGAYPGAPFGDIDQTSGIAKRIGAWVQDYEPLANAYVYRSGLWQRATPKVYRSGSWVDAEGVKVYRSGAWVDAD